jgi:hypothetical protein
VALTPGKRLLASWSGNSLLLSSSADGQAPMLIGTGPAWQQSKVALASNRRAIGGPRGWLHLAAWHVICQLQQVQPGL